MMTRAGRFPVVVLVVLMLAGCVYGAAAKAWRYGRWSGMQPFTGTSGETINYYLFTPRAAGGTKKLPLVVWLHGGLRSNGTGRPGLVQDAFYKDDHQKDHPCFVLRPVAIKGRNWVSPRGCRIGSHKMPAEPSRSMKVAVELIDKIVGENPIDRRRLYVVGASMGGYGTWDIIQRHPKKFAAAMPICGGGDPSKAELIRDMAIWISHGDRDPYVPVRGSREMFEALTKAKNAKPVVKDEARKIVRTSPDGRIRFIEYKGGNHNAAWDRGLKEPDLVEWLFGKSLVTTKSTRRPATQAASPSWRSGCGRVQALVGRLTRSVRRPTALRMGDRPRLGWETDRA